jgi:PadR family transcriptional regulator PadR
MRNSPIERCREFSPDLIQGSLCQLTTLREAAHSAIDVYRRVWMGGKGRDNLQGGLDLLVLKCLEQGPMRGLGITLHIEHVSEAMLRVEEGSSYPAPHRMEQEGWTATSGGMSENNRRARFYRRTAPGRKQLAAERKQW